MGIWILLMLIGVAGAVGGGINAFLSKNGVTLPYRVETDQGPVIQPGVVGNMVVGAVAAVVSWGLYGPLSSATISVHPGAASPEIGMSVSSLVGSILMGMGGARWLTQEAHMRLWKASTVKISEKVDPAVAQQMQKASPAKALNLVKSMESSSPR